MKTKLFGQSLLITTLALVCASCMTTEKRVKSVVVLTTGAARNVTRMTQTPQDETCPVVSPDGKTVAFQVKKGKQQDIWTMDSATLTGWRPQQAGASAIARVPTLCNSPTQACQPHRSGVKPSHAPDLHS